MQQTITIDIVKNQVRIARRREEGGAHILEYATNWWQLHVEALSTLRRRHSSTLLDGSYPCPDDISDRALWCEDEDWMTLAEATKFLKEHGKPYTIPGLVHRAERGDLDLMIVPTAPLRQGRRRVRRSQIELLAYA